MNLFHFILASLSWTLASFTCAKATSDASDVLVAIAQGANVKDLPISEQDKAIASFWLDAVDKPTRCSSVYLKELKKKIKADEEASDMTNIDEFFNFAIYYIMNECGEDVIELGQQLKSVMSDESHLLDYVGFKINRWQHDHNETDASAAFKAMTEWMVRIIGGDKRSIGLEKFSQAWLEGPCKGVLEEMSEPTMIPFAHFIALLDESGFDPLDLEANLTKFYIPIIQSCKYFSHKQALSDVYDALQKRDPNLEKLIQKEASRVSDY